MSLSYISYFFKKIKNFFKSFKKNDFPIPEINSITLGSVIHFNNSLLKILINSEIFKDLWSSENNPNVQKCVGYGFIQLDDETLIHRFYTENDYILQFFTTHENISIETTLYKIYDSIPLYTEQEEKDTLKMLEKKTYSIIYNEKNHTAKRFWYDQSEKSTEVPPHLIEIFYDGKTKKTIEQTCMLYKTESDETFLILKESHPEQNYKTELVGIPLTKEMFI